ncbi:hypothetical protein WDW89_00185 [Deltaproteobacteria bacterium TL4]
MNFWKTALSEDLGEAIFNSLWNQTTWLLNSVIRASSYVENVNSRLRRFFDSGRGQLNQNRLNLIRFYLNHKIFQRGKRAGNSAKSLFKKQEPQHWLDELRRALGEPILQLPDPKMN